MLKKSPGVILFIIVVWAALAVLGFPAFLATVPTKYGQVAYWLLVSLYGWFMLFWLWGLNTFVHQILSFFPKVIAPHAGAPKPDAPVAIIYTTCDDFDPEASFSALQQTHQHTRLVICDDSFDPRNRQIIDTWAAEQKEPVQIIRRDNHEGFKAGNLNQAIRQHIPEEYLVICDADEILPPDFVERLLPFFCEEQVGFVQAGHVASLKPLTQFAASQAMNIDLFFANFLPPKNRFGFVACQGHGMIIRRSVWEAIGGFPEILCEDLGFSSRALAIGYRGVYVPDVIAQEATPPTYKAFTASRSRVVLGTIEYFQKQYWEILRSKHATWSEKLDILISSSSCYIGLVTVVSIWGGLILSHLHKLQGYDVNQPWLPFLYVLGPVGSVAPLLLKVLREPVRYGQYLFVNTANHVSLMPLLALRALEQTFQTRAPFFQVTGKIARQRQQLTDYSTSMPLGVAVMIGSLLLQSPISPIMIGLSLTFLLTPLICLSEQPGLLGAVGRQWGLAPYVAMVVLGVWPR